KIHISDHTCLISFLLLSQITPPPPQSPLFPYTTLFRSRKMKLSQPQQMMAQSREIIEEAYAGDIIGVFDPGIFSIGDTVCSPGIDRKSTRLNSSHVSISYAVFCLKKKIQRQQYLERTTS